MQLIEYLLKQINLAMRPSKKGDPAINYGKNMYITVSGFGCLNIYQDTIETTFSYAGLQSMIISIVKTFDMKFKLYDGDNLLFRLESFTELSP